MHFHLSNLIYFIFIFTYFCLSSSFSSFWVIISPGNRIIIAIFISFLASFISSITSMSFIQLFTSTLASEPLIFLLKAIQNLIHSFIFISRQDSDVFEVLSYELQIWTLIKNSLNNHGYPKNYSHYVFYQKDDFNSPYLYLN